MTDIAMYCLCYQLKENKDTQFLQKNLMCGAANYNQIYKNYLINNSFLLDDTKDNISDLNKWFSQLTGIYWVWKNTSDEIIGINTYRIFWDNNPKITNLANKIYAIKFNLKESLYSQYVTSCSINSRIEYINGLNLLYALSKKKHNWFSTDLLNKSYSTNILYPFLMTISKKHIFDRICEILFDIVFDLWNNHQEYFLEFIYQTNNFRVFDVLGERILTIILLNIKYFVNKNIEVVPSNFYQFNHSNNTNFKTIHNEYS